MRFRCSSAGAGRDSGGAAAAPRRRASRPCRARDGNRRRRRPVRRRAATVARTSTSPVPSSAIAHRLRARDDHALDEHDRLGAERRARLRRASARQCSGSNDTCTMPARSRRSTNTRPPRSRLRCTQPPRRTRRADVRRRGARRRGACEGSSRVRSQSFSAVGVGAARRHWRRARRTTRDARDGSWVARGKRRRPNCRGGVGVSLSCHACAGFASGYCKLAPSQGLG